MTTLKTHQVRLTCPNGHKPTLYVVSGDIAGLSGSYGEFDGDDNAPKIYPVPKDSYAYTHGGCCYQAAVDYLHETR